MSLLKHCFSKLILAALLIGSCAFPLVSQASQTKDSAAVQRLNRDREAALQALSARTEEVARKRAALALAVAAEGAAVIASKESVGKIPTTSAPTENDLLTSVGKAVDRDPAVRSFKASRPVAEADYKAALDAEKAAKQDADVKEAALDDFLGNVETPQWMGLWVLAGVNDLVKANTNQGSSNIKGAKIELGIGNPSRWATPPDTHGNGGVRYPGYHLGGINFTLLNSDPLVVESQDTTTGSTKISTQITYASKSSFEAHYRLMKWVDRSTQEKAWGIIVAGARVISDTNNLRTTTTGGITSVEQLTPPTTIQYTTWKAALRFEFTYGSGYVYQGSFAEAGYLRDPGCIEKPDRMIIRGHWSANVLGGDPKKSGRFFLEGLYLTGRGSQDRASVIIGYQSNLADVRKAFGF